MFDFLMGQTLHQSDFEQQTEFLVPGFLAKNLITLVYADGGMGKSWLAMAVAKTLARSHRVIYLDYDNPLTVLKERGVQDKLIGMSNLLYVQRSKSKLTAPEMLDALNERAHGDSYRGTLIVVDSLRNFGDVMTDSKAMQMMDKWMNLREAGATILILSHANKDGRNYQGSNNIRNSVDNMYRLARSEAPTGQISFVLSVQKERASIVDCAFTVFTENLSMQNVDVDQARMNAEELDFVARVKGVIMDLPGINKKDLLEQLGYEQDDKTARNKLDQFEGVYWKSSKVKGVYTYQLTADTSATTPAH